MHRTEYSRLLILKKDYRSEASGKIPVAQFLIWENQDTQFWGIFSTGRWQRKWLPNLSAGAVIPTEKNPLQGSLDPQGFQLAGTGGMFSLEQSYQKVPIYMGWHQGWWEVPTLPNISPIIGAALSLEAWCFSFFKRFIYLERKSVHMGRGTEEERKNIKQTSQWAGSPIRGSILWHWDHNQSWNQKSDA